MRNLAEYVMRGRKQAILVALVFTLLPLLGWVADVIMALVTLRKGAKEGALVLLWVMLPAVVLALMGYSQLWLYDVIGGSIATYVLAIILRYTNAWSVVLQFAMIIGITAVLVAHALVPELAQHWFGDLVIYLTAIKKQFELNLATTDIQQLAGQLAKFATGIQVALLLLADLFNVFIARWWQSLLYHPAGLDTELRAVRLNFFPVGVMGLALLGSLAGIAPATDSMPVVLLPFVLAGLSLVHSFLVYKNISKFGLVAFYSLLVLLFAYLGVLLVIAALIDCWFDFRKFLTR